MANQHRSISDQRRRRRTLRCELLEDRRLLTSVGTVPFLLILVNNGPGVENAFHPDHDLDFYRALVDGSSAQTNTGTYQSINFSDGNSGVQGQFGRDWPFPEGADRDFVVRASATLQVTRDQAGDWTFGASGSGGIQLSIDGQALFQQNALPAASDTLASVHLDAGSHALDMLFYHHVGAAHVELFLARGV